MLALLDDICEGKGTPESVALLEETAKAVSKASLCGLGKTAPNPVLSTLRYFRDEYMAHVNNKVCPAGQCKALSKPHIDPAKCKGCTACARKCPVNAISGTVKNPHVIDQMACIGCGTCLQTCKFGAISK
jgi:NADH-quinone oxidoreductase subunit F